MGERSPKSKSAGDFWDFLPPVFVKELRQGLRANLFVWPFMAFQFIAFILVALEYGARHFDLLDSGFASGLFIGFNYVVYCLALPLTQFAALQPELAGGRNVELLLLSNLSRWQIVLGKWAVCCALGGLVFISLLPYWQVRYSIGAISDLQETFTHFWAMILINAMSNAIVIGASGYRNFVGRVFMILVSANFAAATVMAANGFFFSRSPLIGLLVSAPLSAALVIALNLQLGRAKLRLFENPLDPPSSALIIVLIVCVPILIAISLGITALLGGYGAPLAALALLVLVICIDPGPGKNNRRWAHA